MKDWEVEKRRLSIVLLRAWDTLEADCVSEGLGEELESFTPEDKGYAAIDYVGEFAGSRRDQDMLCELSRDKFAEVARLAFS